MGAEQPILLVEDNEPTREAMTLALRFQGYPVVCAANGREALDYLRGGGRSCLILLDLMMPVMDGWQFRQEQRQDPVLAAIPVIILSACVSTPQEIANFAAVAFLQKPFAVDELFDLIARAC